jgi:AraC-like DNA-binding protein
MSENNEIKMYVNNPETIKEVVDGVYMDIHGNIFCFNDKYHVKQYTEEFDLRVIGRITPYQTVIINVEDAYKALFGDISDEWVEVEARAPECNESDVEEAAEDTEAPAPLKSDKWVKQKYARYNYRLLKEAYLMVMNNMGSMVEIAEATGVGPTTLSNMCRKKIHVDFTDALDEENGFGKYKSKKRTDASTIEAVYIENKLLGMSVDTISSRRHLAPITVTRIINAETKTAKKVIEECVRSGRYEAARKKIEAVKESEV